jgi:hypothetical protein
MQRDWAMAQKICFNFRLQDLCLIKPTKTSSLLNPKTLLQPVGWAGPSARDRRHDIAEQGQAVVPS